MQPSVSEYVPDLIRWEGSVAWMYLDKFGFVTVGVGNMLPTEHAAMQLLFQNLRTNAPASDAEIRATYLAVKAMKPNMGATFYRRAPQLELLPADIERLLRARLATEFLPGLGRLFPGFEGFPLPARSALVDLAFNLGIGGLGRFPLLLGCVRGHAWADAADNCSRSTSRPGRNQWCREQFLAAAGRPRPLVG